MQQRRAADTGHTQMTKHEKRNWFLYELTLHGNQTLTIFRTSRDTVEIFLCILNTRNTPKLFHDTNSDSVITSYPSSTIYVYVAHSLTS